MPTKQLPPKADLSHLKHQAKDLLRDHRAVRPAALQRIAEFHPFHTNATPTEIAEHTFTLGDAQWTIAREYGFKSWPRLREIVQDPERHNAHLPHHERIQNPIFRQAVDLIDAGAAARLRALLSAHPDLITQRVQFEGGNYFQSPSLLEFVAENPVRNDTLPPNIVAITQILLNAGPYQASKDACLSLVCSGRVVRETGHQADLIAALCNAGADPQTALLPALGHGEFDAVEALIQAGFALTLPTAAATGSVRDTKQALARASPLERHQALALAAQHGHAEVVAILLCADEDPDRYNPPGCHAHSTPLHQAALAGHLNVVTALLAGGARGDILDLHHNSPALHWARHGGNDAIIALLSAETPVSTPNKPPGP